MAKNIEMVNVDEKIASLQTELDNLLREKKHGEIIEAIKLLSFGNLDSVFGFINAGCGAVAHVEKAPRVRKAKKDRSGRLKLSLVDGRVMFGEQAIEACKRDKNGILRVVKTGKGLPADVESQSDDIKAVLLALPVVE